MLNFPSLFSLPLEHPSLLISYLTIGISGHLFYAIILLLFIYFMSCFLPFCISSVVSSTPFSWFYDADLDHRICAKQKFWKNKLNNRVTAMIFSTNNFSEICWTRCVLPGLFDGECHLPPAHLPLFIRQQSRPVHFPDHQSTFLGRCWTIENSLNNKENKSIYLFPGWINTFCQHMARLGCEQDKWVLQKVPIKEWMKHDWSMNS